MKITLDLEPEHLRVLIRSLELKARIGMGQFGEIATDVDPVEETETTFWDRQQQTERACQSILMPELRGGYHSIYSPKVKPEAKLAWDLYKVIREGTNNFANLPPKSVSGIRMPTYEKE